MLTIPYFDTLIAQNGVGLPKFGYKVLIAYDESRSLRFENINFSDYISEDEVPVIVQLLKQAGVKMFTVSSTFSSFPALINAFCKYGCEIAKKKPVILLPYTVYCGKQKECPALVLRIG